MQQLLNALKREVAVGLEELRRGQYTEYDHDSMAAMFEQIKADGKEDLAALKRNQII